jgi:hypothetical protein
VNRNERSNGNTANKTVRLMKLTWVDLDPFAFSRHRESQCRMASRLCCSFWEAMAGLGSIAKSAVLSAISVERPY